MNGLGFDKGHALFFGTEIRQTDTSESQLPIKHLGQGPLIFCLCFAGERDASNSKKGQEDLGEFDHESLFDSSWGKFLLQVRSGTPWHIRRAECVQQPLGIGYIRFH